MTGQTYEARGLRADWLNAWLAAVGVTVLHRGVRLSWTDEARPRALYSTPPGCVLAEELGRLMPSSEHLEGLAIARRHLPRRVTLPAYVDGCERVRASSRLDFSLGMSVTDLVELQPGAELPHSPFDPPAPKGITLWERLVRCRQVLGEGDKLVSAVAGSLEGRGRRHAMNGLGFDVQRIPAAVHGDSDPYVDPVVECLAFFGLSLLPLRGDGRRELGRGWHPMRGRRGSARFRWPAWEPSLDQWGIDAILGEFHRRTVALDEGAQPNPLARERVLRRVGVRGCYEVVAYRKKAPNDVTKGMASRRVW